MTKIGAVNDVGLAGARKAVGGSVGKSKSRGNAVQKGGVAAGRHALADTMGRNLQRGIAKFHGSRGKAIPGAMVGMLGK